MTRRRAPTTAVRHRLLLVLAALLVLGACGEDAAVESPEGTTSPPDEPAGTAPGEPGASPTQTAAPSPTAGATATPGQDGTADPDDGDGGVQPLSGDRSTEERRADPEAGDVAVVGARVAAHDGFDRVVIDIEGDGAPGWWVSYVEEARTAGKGDVIPLEGEAVLSISVQGATLPPDLPEDIEPWIGEGRATPEARVVTAVASDTVFEGVHGVFIGLDRERPYVIGRLEEPQRIVVDIFHD